MTVNAGDTAGDTINIAVGTIVTSVSAFVGSVAGQITDGTAGEAVNSGEVSVHAGTTFTFGGAINTSGGSASADILSGSEYTIQSGGGDVTLTATDAIQLDSVNAGSGDAIVTADTDNAGGGNITDNLSGAAANVTAAAAALRAASGIGTGDDINIAVSTFAASNATSGVIHVANNVGGLLTIGTVDTLVGVTNSGTSASPGRASGSGQVPRLLAPFSLANSHDSTR